MLIKITNGITRIGSETKSPASGWFEVSEEAGNRLVSLGVAETKADDVLAVVIEGNIDDLPEVEFEKAGEGIPYFGMDMKATELRKLAHEHGISFPAGTTKEAMVKALVEHFSVESYGISACDPVIDV